MLGIEGQSPSPARLLKMNVIRTECHVETPPPPTTTTKATKTTFLISCGKIVSAYMGKLQQLQEQRYIHFYQCVRYFLLCKQYGCQCFGIFNVHSDSDACICMYAVCTISRKESAMNERTLRSSLSGTFLQRKAVVNQCLEFAMNVDDERKRSPLVVTQGNRTRISIAPDTFLSFWY